MPGRLIPLTWAHDPTIYAPPRYKRACQYEAFVPEPIGAMSLSLQHTKVTWLLLALIAARSAGEEERHIVQARATDRARYGVRHAAAAGTGGFVVRQPGL